MYIQFITDVRIQSIWLRRSYGKLELKNVRNIKILMNGIIWGSCVILWVSEFWSYQKKNGVRYMTFCWKLMKIPDMICIWRRCQGLISVMGIVTFLIIRFIKNIQIRDIVHSIIFLNMGIIILKYRYERSLKKYTQNLTIM